MHLICDDLFRTLARLSRTTPTRLLIADFLFFMGNRLILLSIWWKKTLNLYQTCLSCPYHQSRLKHFHCGGSDVVVLLSPEKIRVTSITLNSSKVLFLSISRLKPRKASDVLRWVSGVPLIDFDSVVRRTGMVTSLLSHGTDASKPVNKTDLTGASNQRYRHFSEHDWLTVSAFCSWYSCSWFRSWK